MRERIVHIFGSTRHWHGMFGGKGRACFMSFGAFVIALIFVSESQSQQGGDELQQKFTAVRQRVIENQESLRQYQWVETTQVSYKGEVKSVRQASCSYGPDGKVQKVPIMTTQDAPSGGRLKQRIIEKKKEELQGYMEQVKGLIGLYVPPDPAMMMQAFQAGNVSLNGTPAPGVVQLVFKNYAEQGDSMALSFLTMAKKLTALNVNSYLNQPQDVVTLSVQFASLPDGTNYPNQVIVVAQAKEIQVTVTNSDYQKIATE